MIKKIEEGFGKVAELRKWFEGHRVEEESRGSKTVARLQLEEQRQGW
jgi:hypothetical protein